MFDVVFRNARIVTATGILEGDLGVYGGKISEIGKVSGKTLKEIDASGKVLLPGVIDIHVHFRDPGFPEKGDFASESKAAAAGGVTTILDMPNTNPPTLTVSALEDKRKIALQKSLVNFGFYLGLSSSNFQEIEKAENIAGVKVYMASTTGELLMEDAEIIEKLFETGKFVIVHAEDEAMIQEREKKNKNFEEPKIHSFIRDRKAAYEAVRKILHLAKKHQAQVHVTHITTKDEAEEIKKFKTAEVSCDVTPHHLALTDAAYEKLGNLAKVNPPLRREKDRQALWESLKDGIIEIVASDHAPHTRSEKEQEYSKVPAGAPGVQTLLPFLLDSVEHGDLLLQDVARLTAENPARILGIKNKGRIEVGYDADLVLVDMKAEKELTPEMLFSKCGWSPFLGWKFHGFPFVTMVNGNIVYQEGKIVSDIKGNEVQFEG